jgi:hypothetical protein
MLNTWHLVNAPELVGNQSMNDYVSHTGSGPSHLSSFLSFMTSVLVVEKGSREVREEPALSLVEKQEQMHLV